MKHWLIKSEPAAYSIDQMAEDGRTLWTGVRNYQARNFMAEMAVGDLVLFYHSSTEPPGVAGLVRVSAAAVPDPTQFDPRDAHHEPRATKAKPVWSCVEVEFLAKAPEVLPVDALRADPPLADMVLLQRGSRLSITPVTAAEFQRVCALAGLRPPA